MGQQVSKVPGPAQVVQDAAGAVKDTAVATKEVVAAVGAEDRAANRIQKSENWGRVEDGDTLWDLSERHLGDPYEWATLHAACRRELETDDPDFVLAGSHVTEDCVARARALLRKQ